MTTVRVGRAHGLIVVPARLWGPRGDRKLHLAVDTGATETLILPEIIHGLGYSPRDGERMTKIRSAIGEEPGYMIRVSRFRVLNHEFPDLLVHAHDLPDGFGIDGLLGLNILDQFNCELRPLDGVIRVERLFAR